MTRQEGRRHDPPAHIACALRAVQAALRGGGDPGSEGGVGALGPPGWSALAEHSVAHGIEGLVWSGLRGTAAIPEPLERGFVRSAAWAVRLASECIRIVGKARAAGLPLLPWKGPTLAAAAYGNVALRPCGDLDFVVARSDLARGEALLAALGYRKVPSNPRATNLRRRLRDYNIVLQGPLSDGVVVELHYAWSPLLFHRPAGALLGDIGNLPVAEYDVCGVGVRSLAPLALLETLFVHGAKHGWDRLIWIADVAGLLARHPGLAEQALARFPRGSTGERFALFGLGLAHGVLGSRVPPGTAETIAERGLDRPLAVTIAKLTGSLGASPEERRLFATGVTLETSKLHLRLYGTAGERLSYCASAGGLWLWEKTLAALGRNREASAP